MTRALLTRSISVLFLLGVIATGAAAEPIAITSGQIRGGHEAPFFVQLFSGADSFNGLIFHGLEDAAWRCGFGCLHPGARLNLSATFVGPLPAPFELTHSLVGGRKTEYEPSAQLVGRLRIDAGDVILKEFDSPVLLTTPFDIDGSLTAYAFDDTAHENPLFTLSLRGSGTAALRFDDFSVEANTWVEAIPTYDFVAAPAAVPEPATVTLLGIGVAGLVARVRRKQ